VADEPLSFLLQRRVSHASPSRNHFCRCARRLSRQKRAPRRTLAIRRDPRRARATTLAFTGSSWARRRMSEWSSNRAGTASR